MAKSLRSKVKRSFRAKKRSEGIYAATEAARLHRLNSKIRANIAPQVPEDLGGESPRKDQAEELSDEEQTGPYWFELLGLLGHEQLDPERMHAVDTLVRVCERRGGMKRVVVVNVDEEGQQPSTKKQGPSDTMDVDSSVASSSQRISTHGPRNSRREDWRTSKGLTARPKQRSMNRQGGIAARRNAGRAHRRR